MTETATKLPIKTENAANVPAPQPRSPLAGLRHEIERLFDEFDGSFWSPSFRRSLFDFLPFGHTGAIANMPAVDIAERNQEYEITAEIPGMDERDIEVKLVNGGLVIKGEKKVEKEEKKKDYFVSERRYGSFQRFFSLPAGVDTDKISATFKNGVLTVALPKNAEAKKQQKEITVKAA